MEFEGEFVVDESREEVWPYFNDPDVLEKCAPGCKEITMESASELQATLSVGVGSVKPTFDVDAVVTENEKPRKLGVRASGEASRNSFSVTAEQELISNGENSTKVQWHAKAEVSGMIASLGERALDSVTDRLVNEFFNDLEREIEKGTEATDKLEAHEAETNKEVEEQLQVKSQDGLLSMLSELAERTLQKDISIKYLLSLVSGSIIIVVGGLLWSRQKQNSSNKKRISARKSGASVAIGVIAGIAAKTLLDYLRSGGTRTSETGSINNAEATAEEAETDRVGETKETKTSASNENSEPVEGLYNNPIDQLD